MLYLLLNMSNSLNNYKFVVATEYNEEDFWNKAKISLFLEKTGHAETAEIVYQNKEGLSKVYNSFINEDNKSNFLIFVHDDVFIDDLFIEEKLNIGFDKYDIIGLAGAKSCNLTAPLPAWHLMSDKSDYVGEVAHSNGNDIWTTVFGPTDSRALIVDGLFIAVNTAKLIDTDTYFDENFDFHHYDISFCLKANQNKLKIGVMPIKVTHFGLGDSMGSPEWQKSSEIFKRICKK